MEHSIEKYQLNFFGTSCKDTPHTIVELDNNFELLLACLDGCTHDNLRKMGALDSQLRLLEDWRLLNKKDQKYYTSILFLTKEKMDYIRNTTEKLANEIGNHIVSSVNELCHHLQECNKPKNAYSIFFSYILDHLVWNDLVEANRFRNQKITSKKPHWAGMFYALHPKREFYCGTNTIISKKTSLYINWSEQGQELIFSLFAQPQLVFQFLEDWDQNERIIDNSVRTYLESFDLLGVDGQLAIPIIQEYESDRLFTLCKTISTEIAKSVNEVDFKQIGNHLSIANKGEIITILYHELIWDILGFFEGLKIISKPRIFEDTHKSNISDLKDLLIIGCKKQ